MPAVRADSSCTVLYYSLLPPLLRYPISSSAFKSLRQLSTAATRSPPFLCHRQRSGRSPIIQDGKLVGAVTHVLVNDPTTGYGIFIENMLDAAA